MPRVKQPDDLEKDKHVRAELAKAQELQGLSNEEVAMKMHTTRQTYKNKKDHPRTFTLGELRNLKRILKLDASVFEQFL